MMDLSFLASDVQQHSFAVGDFVGRDMKDQDVKACKYHTLEEHAAFHYCSFHQVVGTFVDTVQDCNHSQVVSIADAGLLLRSFVGSLQKRPRPQSAVASQQQ